MSNVKKLSESLEGRHDARDIMAFIEDAKDAHDINPNLAAAVILHLTPDKLDDLKDEVLSDYDVTINGFEYYAELLDFWQQKGMKKAVRKWYLSEYESLSHIYTSSIDMIAQLELIKREDVTVDELARLMWQSDVKNRNKDLDLFEIFVVAICQNLATSVISNYANFLRQRQP